MKHLYLVRHAKSSWNDASLSDFDRPLNKRGKHDAPLMGKRMAACSIKPDLVFASPSKRTRETLKLLSPAADLDAVKVQFIDQIYEASTHALLQLLNEAPDSAACLVILGHNPSITHFAERLTGEYYGNVPTAGMIGISFPLEAWSHITTESGSQFFYEYPKMHY